jgi:uncharacterized RDD family membrane protein YckC
VVESEFNASDEAYKKAATRAFVFLHFILVFTVLLYIPVTILFSSVGVNYLPMFPVPFSGWYLYFGVILVVTNYMIRFELQEHSTPKN